jgi:hypothetical protein
MGEVAYGLQVSPEHKVEIVVHVDEMLGEQQRNELVEVLNGTEGIHSAEFCPLRFHLMLVQYDSNNINSRDVLSRVKAQSVHAELIGPV